MTPDEQARFDAVLQKHNYEVPNDNGGQQDWYSASQALIQKDKPIVTAGFNDPLHRIATGNGGENIEVAKGAAKQAAKDLSMAGAEHAGPVGAAMLDNAPEFKKNIEAFDTEVQPTNDLQKEGARDTIMAESVIPAPGIARAAAPAFDATIDAAKIAKKGISSPIQTTMDVAEAAKQKTGDLYYALRSPNAKDVDSFITNNYTRAVRPSVVGKNTASQIEAANQKAIGAVKTIVENKPNIDIKDIYGESTGRLPETLGEFTQAIEQTKGAIFKQYNALQQAAGEAGTKINLNPVADELTKISESPVIKDLNPELAKYAENRASAFTKRGSYSPEDTQDAIKNLNSSLEAFYKNPAYDTASRASVDAMIVNKLRSGLDDAIESVGTPGYQELKGKYGALKSIEKDVTHRMVVDARKNSKGLLDFSDIASAAEVIKGLSTLHPGSIAAGAVMKGISSYYKFLNNPNTSIKLLFKGVENAARP